MTTVSPFLTVRFFTLLPEFAFLTFFLVSFETFPSVRTLPWLRPVWARPASGERSAVLRVAARTSLSAFRGLGCFLCTLLVLAIVAYLMDHFVSWTYSEQSNHLSAAGEPSASWWGEYPCQSPRFAMSSAQPLFRPAAPRGSAPDQRRCDAHRQNH